LITHALPLSPIGLIAEQLDCETVTLPTGAHVFRRGEAAQTIYAISRGIVELVSQQGETICYRSGEFFCYQDIIWREGRHRDDALARSPVEILSLDRLSFLNLLHNHPTLAVQLIGQQHDRLREQRVSGACCY
jgi:CRP-like cAMP-binding protein